MNPDQHTTPPPIQLDSDGKYDNNWPESVIKGQKPESVIPTTSQITDPNMILAETNTEMQNQNPISTQSYSKPKLTGMTKRRASWSMKSRPPRKTSEFHIRHNTRPIRARQPPSLLGERVFTSLVETSDDRPGEHTSTNLTTPLSNPALEAISIETESHQIDVVDLTSPLTSPLQLSFLDNFTRRGPRLVGKTKSSLTISPTVSPNTYPIPTLTLISSTHLQSSKHWSY